MLTLYIFGFLQTLIALLVIGTIRDDVKTVDEHIIFYGYSIIKALFWPIIVLIAVHKFFYFVWR